MKSYYCDKLETTLHFLPAIVKFCCSCAEGISLDFEDFNYINKQKIITTRKKYIDLLNKGKLPKECHGCVDYKSKNILEQLKSCFGHSKNKKITVLVYIVLKKCYIPTLTSIIIFCRILKIYMMRK